MLNILPKFELGTHQDILGHVLNRAAPAGHRVAHDRKVVLQQYQIGSRARDVGGAIDRYSDVGRVQRWSVIDAIAHETNDISEPLQRQKNLKLLLRIDAAEQVDARQLPHQRLVREMRQFIAREHSRDGHANLGKDVTRHEFVVAGEHLDGDARGSHGLDGNAGACLWRIEEYGEAGKNQIALVTDCGSLVAHVDHATGYSQGAESLSAEIIERGLEGIACLRVE
jgi:hypothetical protein